MGGRGGLRGRPENQVGRRDVVEDFGFGGEDFDAEVIGADVEGRVGLVGDADVGPGVAALVSDGDHDGEAGGVEDLVVVAVDGLTEAAGVWFAADNVVGEDGFGDTGGDREGRGGENSREGEFLKERHRGLLR